ncbi:MAG: flagellar protein FlaG [Anaerolineales bacterium]
MSDMLSSQINQAAKIQPVSQGAVTYAQIEQTGMADYRAKATKDLQIKADEEKLKKLNEKFSKPLGDVSLKFKVDEDTHDVTVFIVDNVSKKVVRTIPPEEMAKINAGELLQLFA